MQLETPQPDIALAMALHCKAIARPMQDQCKTHACRLKLGTGPSGLHSSLYDFENVERNWTSTREQAEVERRERAN